MIILRRVCFNSLIMLFFYLIDVYQNCKSTKTSKLSVTGPWNGNPLVTGGFSSQRASSAENVSIWWHCHDRNDVVVSLSSVYTENRLIICYTIYAIKSDKRYLQCLTLKNLWILPVKIEIYFFQLLMKPTLVYGNDVWVANSNDTKAIDKILLWYARTIL